jgi:ribosomal protein S14
MTGQTECPRCGARDSFIKGYLPETCVCRICLSQLDWREIPGCGPDCSAAELKVPAGQTAAGEDPKPVSGTATAEGADPAEGSGPTSRHG